MGGGGGTISERHEIRNLMKILFIGDIVAKAGREIVRRAVPPLVERHDIDLTIANVENAAGGRGVTRDVAEAILAAGVDVMTTGNHVWDKKEVLDYIRIQPRLIRPANFPSGVPGRGRYIAHARGGEPVAVVNVMGRIFMNPLDNPFAVVREAIEAVRGEAGVVVVDFHAEATSEKLAMGWHLDGRATAVIGTHTHVQTADERLLPRGTAYITDVGMTGAHDSIIGVEVRPVLQRFLDGMPAKFDTASGNPRLNAVVITADAATGMARGIERVSVSAQDVEAHAAQRVAT